MPVATQSTEGTGGVENSHPSQILMSDSATEETLLDESWGCLMASSAGVQAPSSLSSEPACDVGAESLMTDV